MPCPDTNSVGWPGVGPDLGSAQINPNAGRRASERARSNGDVGAAGLFISFSRGHGVPEVLLTADDMRAVPPPLPARPASIAIPSSSSGTPAA